MSASRMGSPKHASGLPMDNRSLHKNLEQKRSGLLRGQEGPRPADILESTRNARDSTWVRSVSSIPSMMCDVCLCSLA